MGAPWSSHAASSRLKASLLTAKTVGGRQQCWLHFRFHTRVPLGTKSVVWCQTLLSYSQGKRIKSSHKSQNKKEGHYLRWPMPRRADGFPVHFSDFHLLSSKWGPPTLEWPQRWGNPFSLLSSNEGYWFMNVNDRSGFDVPLKVASPALAFESFIGRFSWRWLKLSLKWRVGAGSGAEYFSYPEILIPVLSQVLFFFLTPTSIGISHFAKNAHPCTSNFPLCRCRALIS